MTRPTLDPNAENYDQIWERSVDFSPPSEDILAHCFLKGVDQSTIRIVDVASGNGRYAAYFNTQNYKHVTAIELSQKGCHIIRTRAAKAENITVINANLLRLDSDHTHDIVVCSGLLEEFVNPADQTAAVKILQSMTAPDGKIILRYCLSISSNNPADRVDENLVPSLFCGGDWQIEQLETDAQPKEYSVAQGVRHFIRRQTLVASRWPGVFAPSP